MGVNFMEKNGTSERPAVAKLFTGAMILIGIYALLRHGGEWAYALGKLVGSN